MTEKELRDMVMAALALAPVDFGNLTKIDEGIDGGSACVGIETNEGQLFIVTVEAS